MTRNLSLALPGAFFAGCLLAGALVAGSTPAVANDPNPSLDALDNALAAVERTSTAVIAGVANGTINVATDGPAIVAAFTRLTLSSGRLETLAARPAPVVEDAALADVAAEPEDVPVHGRPPATTGTRAPTTEVTRIGGGTAKATPAQTSATTAPAAATSKTSSAAVAGVELTGIASVDKFLASAAKLSSDMAGSQKKMESARGTLTSSLGLEKKFKSDDVKSAMKAKLGTGYKVSMGSPPKVVPGPDAKDPAVATAIQSAISDLVSLKATLPTLVATAVDLGKQGATLPTTAKSELMALGPMGSAKAVGTLTKQVKVVTKIPKDAKELGEEVAMWTKMFGG